MNSFQVFLCNGVSIHWSKHKTTQHVSLMYNYSYHISLLQSRGSYDNPQHVSTEIDCSHFLYSTQYPVHNLVCWANSAHQSQSVVALRHLSIGAVTQHVKIHNKMDLQHLIAYFLSVVLAVCIPPWHCSYPTCHHTRIPTLLHYNTPLCLRLSHQPNECLYHCMLNLWRKLAVKFNRLICGYTHGISHQHLQSGYNHGFQSRHEGSETDCSHCPYTPHHPTG